MFSKKMAETPNTLSYRQNVSNECMYSDINISQVQCSHAFRYIKVMSLLITLL